MTHSIGSQCSTWWSRAVLWVPSQPEWRRGQCTAACTGPVEDEQSLSWPLLSTSDCGGWVSGMKLAHCHANSHFSPHCLGWLALRCCTCVISLCMWSSWCLLGDLYYDRSTLLYMTIQTLKDKPHNITQHNIIQYQLLRWHIEMSCTEVGSIYMLWSVALPLVSSVGLLSWCILLRSHLVSDSGTISSLLNLLTMEEWWPGECTV